jgi:hypothetical protein
MPVVTINQAGEAKIRVAVQVNRSAIQVMGVGATNPNRTTRRTLVIYLNS